MKFKKHIHFICVSFLLATTSISLAQTSPNQMPVPMQLPSPAFPPQPQNAWTKQAAMELNNTVLVVSSDVKKFFTKYPDFVADTFGGQAYNLKEFFKKKPKTLAQNI